jgi:hypothetical protein
MIGIGSTARGIGEEAGFVVGCGEYFISVSI